MKKLLLILVLFGISNATTADLAAAGLVNWVGYNDTVIFFIGGDDTIRYSRPFNLSDFEHMRLIAKANDTSAAGLVNDSIKVGWGYQTGSITLNSSGLKDTLWNTSQRIRVDTMNSTKVAPVGGTVDSAGTITQTWGQADTLSGVSGFYVQSRNFPVNWDEIIRFWVVGVAGNNVARQVKIVIDVKRRLSDMVKLRQ